MKLSKKITALILATLLLFTTGIITAFAEDAAPEQPPKEEKIDPESKLLSLRYFNADTAQEEKLWDGLSDEYVDENGVKMVYQNKKNYIVSNDNSNYLYRLDEQGNATIACNFGGEKLYDEISIPSTIDGHTVTKIDAFGFYMCNRVSGIRIPDTVKEIGYYAFGFCTKLERLVIGTGVENFCADALIGTSAKPTLCFAVSEEQADSITVWSYKDSYVKTSCDWKAIKDIGEVLFSVNVAELEATSQTSALNIFEIIWQYIKDTFEIFKSFIVFIFTGK